MGRYLVRRIFASLVSIFGLAILCFILLRLFPGGPFDEEIPLSAEVLANLQVQYGLDKSLFEQFKIFTINLFQFELGPSTLFPGQSVFDIIMRSWAVSLKIGSWALFFSVLGGLLIGLFSFTLGLKKSSNTFQLFFNSTPSLFLAPSLILIFGYWLDWLPVVVNDSILSLVLPVAVLGIRPMANIARLVQGSLAETMLEPWVTTTRSFGFSKGQIIYKFAIKQSLIPVISYLGALITNILSGSLLVEIVFNVQGSGMQYIEALVNRDYSLVIGLTLLYGTMLIITNLGLDLLMYKLEPRMEKL